MTIKLNKYTAVVTIGIAVVVVIVLRQPWKNATRQQSSLYQKATTQAAIDVNTKTLKVGQKAPDFDVTTIDGKQLTLAYFKNNILVITSGAAWCPTCIIENKNFNPVFQEVKEKGVEFITVSIDGLDSLEALQEFQTRYAPWHNVHVSQAKEMINDYGFWRFEITYIIDGDGIVQFTDSGITETKTLRAELNKLI